MNLEAGDRLEDGTVLFSRHEFAEWLRRRVNERVPAAVVRLGSGEARLLTSCPDDGESMTSIVSHLAQETGLSLSSGAVREIKALVALAYDEADVLGIRFHERSSIGEHKKWMNRLTADYSARVAAGRSPVMLAHAQLNHDIVDGLPELLAGHRVSVISCRNLVPVLEAEWGLDDVAVYQIPSQHIVRDIDGAYEAAMHDTPIWPDVHARLGEELTVRERGEVFLVGAGLFGKDLCIRIREQGGIGLDMGSALDRIAGKITRGPRRRVLDLYAAGMSMDEIAASLQRLYGAQVDHDRISKGIADAVLDDIAAWQAQPLQAAYPNLYFDTLQVEVGQAQAPQSRTCHLAVGVTCDGYRDPVGIWWQDTEDAELWPAVLNELHERGVRELSIACLDDLQGPLSDAVKAVFPQTRVQAIADPIESCSAVRGAIEAHGRFADEQAATALIYLALSRAEAKLTRGRGDVTPARAS